VWTTKNKLDWQLFMFLTKKKQQKLEDLLLVEKLVRQFFISFSGKTKH
jgi:hypothetical protein